MILKPIMPTWALWLWNTSGSSLSSAGDNKWRRWLGLHIWWISINKKYYLENSRCCEIISINKKTETSQPQLPNIMVLSYVFPGRIYEKHMKINPTKIQGIQDREPFQAFAAAVENFKGVDSGGMVADRCRRIPCIIGVTSCCSCRDNLQFLFSCSGCRMPC